MHRYSYEEISRFKVSMPGMSTEGTVTVRANFSQKVLNTKPDGHADMELSREDAPVSRFADPSVQLLLLQAAGDQELIPPSKGGLLP